jgi:pimeloyl-ACP methyl ester carboxylesterase
VGTYLDTGAGHLHWMDHGGEGVPIVLVHGLGGSTIDWDAVAGRLTDLGRVVAPDLPTFGLSPPCSRKGLSGMVDALEGFVATHVDESGRPATVVGNSMGGLVAVMLAARRPELVGALVLVSPAFPPRPADVTNADVPTAVRLAVQAAPGTGEVLAQWMWRRLTPRERVFRTLGWVTHKPGRVPLEVVESLIEMSERRESLPWARTAVTDYSRSIAALWARRQRFIATVREVTAPTLVVQGTSDHLIAPAVVEAVCALRPDWELVQMEDTGHTPQLDAPIRFLEVVRPWIGGATAR